MPRSSQQAAVSQPTVPADLAVVLTASVLQLNAPHVAAFRTAHEVTHKHAWQAREEGAGCL